MGTKVMLYQVVTTWVLLSLKRELVQTTTVPGGPMATGALPRRPTPSGTWDTFPNLHRNSTTEPQETSGSEAKTRSMVPQQVTQLASTTYKPATQTIENSSITTPKTPKTSMIRPLSQISDPQTITTRCQRLSTCDDLLAFIFYNIIFKRNK